MIKKILALLLITLNLGICAQDMSSPLAHQMAYRCNCVHWKSGVILNPTERKPARTAILIIAPPEMNNSDVERRWKLGKKTWEQYMNSHPQVDCYFIRSACFKKNSSETAWIEGNTIYIADSWYENNKNDRILNKTIKSLELLLPNYTHFFRANLNVFLNIKNLNEYAETHHQSFFTTPIWQGEWYAIGYSIFFTQDVAAHMCNEYERLENAGEELISCHHADDSAITALATGIWPYNKPHPFKCCPTLRYSVRQLMCENSFNSRSLSRYGALLTPAASLNQIISLTNQASRDVILYRTKDGLSLEEHAKFYQHMLNKVYPELSSVDMVDYLNSIR